MREILLPVSNEDRVEIAAELEQILASTPFRNSRRYPAMLRYVVEKALEGRHELLKERLIGVEVFHRAVDYDTNADPVVRFSAGEVRRRIALYYQQSPLASGLKIFLPTGSYVPQFFRVKDDAEELPEIQERTQTDREFQTSADGGRELYAETRPVVAPAATSLDARCRLFAGGLLCGIACTLAIYLGVFAVQSFRSANSPLVELWKPLLNSPNPIIISVGRTQPGVDQESGSADATIEQHLLRPAVRISLPAVHAIAEVSGFLIAHHRTYRLHEAYADRLQDMHGNPVVLIAAFNNIWTLRLLEPLRFHFGMAGSLHYIEDRKHPTVRTWAVDFDAPYQQETADYAVVARFTDKTTGSPVIVIAGIGSDGTLASGDFMTSPDTLQQIARLSPDGKLDKNFEAVLKVEVVDGDPGAVSVQAAEFW